MMDYLTMPDSQVTRTLPTKRLRNPLCAFADCREAGAIDDHVLPRHIPVFGGSQLTATGLTIMAAKISRI
jgi:hypothetical protein